MIQFLPLGSAGEIGASCFYLNLDGTGILLDCGMHPKKKGLNALPDFDLLQDKPIDYVLISHAHQDHLNGLPFLVKKFPHIKIVTTPQTRAVAELTLRNAISILKKQLNDEQFEIYSHEELDLLIKTIEYKAYEEEFHLTGFNNKINEPVVANFFDAGHIIGSAGIYLCYENHKIYYTGDINISKQTLLTGARLPAEKIDTLITETTYGATDSLKINFWDEEVNQFGISLSKIINSGGSVLVPVFSLGKMQEILSAIYLLMKQGKLTPVDIYTGGIGRKINRVYDYNRFVLNYNQPEIIVQDIPQKNIRDVNNFDEFFRFPSIVLASSGMMIESTISFTLAKRWLKQKGSAIFTVGYMDEDTPGYIIANSKMGEKINLTDFDKNTEVKCEIKNFSFSAHSKREELLGIVKKLNPENLILVHGDGKAINWLGNQSLKQFSGIKVYAASQGKEILFA